MAYQVTPRQHIVRVPRHMILLRIFQLLLAAIILAVTAYGVHVLGASGIILTLVTGRPTPPAFHAEDFVTSTHGNSTNSTFTSISLHSSNNTAPGANFSVVGEGPSGIEAFKLPHLTPKIMPGPVVTQALSPKILDPQAPVPGPPSLTSKVQKRAIIKPGEYFPDIQFDLRDLDMAKYCRHPHEPRDNPETVPHQLNDWNDRFRATDYISLTGHGKNFFKRVTSMLHPRTFKQWLDAYKQDVRAVYAEHNNGKSYGETIKERTGLGQNPWGSPLKNRNRVEPKWLMMGHLQTALLSILHLSLYLFTTHCPTFAKFYDYPLLLILEFFLLVLWLISFCILAAQVAVARAAGTFPRFRAPLDDIPGRDEVMSAGIAPMIVWLGNGTACGEDGYCYTYASLDKRKHFLSLMAGTAALSALMFLTYLISFGMFLASVLKHRREGGLKQPLSPSASQPGPFSFDETRDNRSSYTRGNDSATDEEAWKHGVGKKSKLEKMRDKEAKRAAKEDRKAMKNMRKGGLPKGGKPTILTSSGGIFDGPITDDEWRGRSTERGARDGGKKEKKERSYRLTLHGLERQQMKHALSMSELEPAQPQPYQRGA